MGTLRGALAIAAQVAGLFVVRVPRGGARIVRGVLELGPDATATDVAGLACRRALERSGAPSDNGAVAEMAASYGFDMSRDEQSARTA